MQCNATHRSFAKSIKVDELSDSRDKIVLVQQEGVVSVRRVAHVEMKHVVSCKKEANQTKKRNQQTKPNKPNKTNKTNNQRQTNTCSQTRRSQDVVDLCLLRERNDNVAADPEQQHATANAQQRLQIALFRAIDSRTDWLQQEN
jgi:hypothetical protein